VFFIFLSGELNFLFLHQKVHTVGGGGGVSVPRPLQGPVRSSGSSFFFDSFFTPGSSLTLPWGHLIPPLGAASCLNY
jgi:hypothetical protein